jgi:hypothetical protein
MSRKLFYLLMLLVCISTQLNGAGALFSCNVGGATFEYLDDETNTWKDGGTFPRLFSVPRYTYIVIRATAQGYEDFEQGFEVCRADLNEFRISLIPESSNPESLPLFGIVGQIVSRKGLRVLKDTYKVVSRNLTTYRKTDAFQVSQDINPNNVDGWYTNVFANLATNRAVAVGDRVFSGVFNSNMTRCYGYAVTTLTEEHLSEGHVMQTILIR